MDDRTQMSVQLSLARSMDRPLRKIVEHLEDAAFHIENSTLSGATKARIYALLHEAAKTLREGDGAGRAAGA